MGRYPSFTPSDVPQGWSRLIETNLTPDPAAAVVSHKTVRRLGPREFIRLQRMNYVLLRHLAPGLLRKKNRTPEKLAPRLYRVTTSLGPPLVKLSQVVSSSPGLFPAPIANQLRDLLDAAPPEKWDHIRPVLEKGLGGPVDKFFAKIDTEPMAAASIAQVHAATLHDGTEVVVKIRRPGIEKKFRRDLRLLRVTAIMANKVSKSARVVNPVAIVDDVVTTLGQELDFGREAASMERFAANLQAFGDNDRIRVPKVHHEYCGHGVLTMERINGTKVDDLPSLVATGFDLFGLLRAGVRAWIEAACEHGFFHGDVHAGNLMVDDQGKVVFLDFGITGQLDDTTRQLVRRGVVALLHRQDFGEVTTCLTELGAHLGHRTDHDKAAAAIARLVTPWLAKPIAEIDYLEIFGQAVRMAAPKGVQLPRSLVLLGKQILYFERYAVLVAPDYDILQDRFLIQFMIDAETPAPAPEAVTPADELTPAEVARRAVASEGTRRRRKRPVA
ncbi:MAG TPA: AarF/UbiB family protein [Acidimicrobiales bacterium]|nr:AarF/UbiB family protein [Acidimicrobiales bacterium]